MLLDEAVQRLMDEAATQVGAGCIGQCRQLVELQDVARVDRIGIGEPGLDSRHAEAARTQADRRTGRGPRRGLALGRFVAQGGPGEPRRLGGWRQGVFQSEPAQQRPQPQQPARRHGGGAVHLRRAREKDLGRAQRLGEIVREKTDALLGRGQPDRLQHAPVEPGAGIRRLWPDALVETTENDDIGLL